MKERVPTPWTEARLEELRREAGRAGRVEGPGVRPSGAPFPVATPETGYYGLPPLKPPTWTWEVPVYFFLGGAAGASA
ncbi:MAG: nitrite reductase, partial [Acidobacteriota bacterium]|nr:nitrite reductase [Acidobacteriota bacterium]